MQNKLPIALTGDRPTGPLHLGHYTGSLKNRLSLQETHEQFILVADLQALTDNARDPGKVRSNVVEVVLDYLAVGIDPDRTTICLQSGLPALAELTNLYMNFVTVSRLERNPTIREEIQKRRFERDVPAGFLAYPVSQAADITAFGADVVPAGADQIPIVEQTVEIVRRVNSIMSRPVLKEPRLLVPEIAGRLPGIDGQGKMSKSAGNAIPLGASPDEISMAVKMMFTDPGHIRVADPGKVEGNVVFAMLDAFDTDQDEVADLKDRYRAGGLGDMSVKRRLEPILQELLRPIRERREDLAQNRDHVLSILRAGTERSREITGNICDDVFDAAGIFRL